ncbi:MAG TPA: MBL fold metallo-hydrolase [Gemmataceae bacterium]|nr:MBL fold metallo-hydrolase [Gemmataceae bacterium]
MLRYLTALAAALALAAGAGAADKKLTIRWHGQSFFEIISSEGTRVVTDPHAIDAFGRQSVKADLVLISHLHSDHTRLDVIEEKPKPKVLYGVKEDKGTARKFTWTNFDEKFKDVHVYSVGTYHDDEQGLKRGLNSCMVIEVDGFRVVHLGDLGHKLSPDQVKSIGKVDVLMVPVGGIYTLNGSEAKEVVEQLRPRYAIIPMHYGIKGTYEDLLPADEFLEDQKNVRKDHPPELTLDVGAKPPEKPEIVLPAWHGIK